MGLFDSAISELAGPQALNSNDAVRTLLGIQQPGSTGTITPRHPSWREKSAGWIQDLLEKAGTNRYTSRKIAENLLNILERNGVPVR
jgi:hypothetical protein